MKNRKIILTIILLIFFVIQFFGPISMAKESNSYGVISAESIGIGGAGCTNTPIISPFDSNTMLVLTDMGGFFVSHDAGKTWSRKETKGRVYSAYFDPNNEGVIYVGGSGLWKSTDNGDTFKLYYPDENDIYSVMTRLEQPMTFIYSKDADYDAARQIRGIEINPSNSNNIFVLQYADYDKKGNVFESKDGKTFNKIFEYNCDDSFNKMYYDEDGLILINSDGIYKYNFKEKKLYTVYDSFEKDIIDVVKAEDDYIFVVKADSSYSDRALTKVVYTKDFKDYTDITMDILNTIDSYVVTNNYSDINFKANITHISATSINDIALTNQYDDNELDFSEYISSVFRYRNSNGQKSVNFIYGAPFVDDYELENHGWSRIDAVYEMYGVMIDPKEEDTVLFTTLCGIYYYKDGKVYQRNTNKVVDKNGNVSYTSNGMDMQTTYSLRTDPFNPNHVFMNNTDLGLIESNDNGKTWTRDHTGINDKWTNTSYDLVFDEYEQGVLYSVWSSRHDAPIMSSTYDERSYIYGGFAVSKDGGKTWDSNAEGLPEYIIPVKIAVVYNEESDDRTIYVTSFNCGTYVSYDSGKTFTEFNKGIEKIKSSYDGFEYVFGADIEAVDGKVFLLTARSVMNTNDSSVQNGKVYELVGDTWKEISLDDYNVECPRDIYYNNGMLYITATTADKYKYQENTTVDREVYGGGIYTYDGEKVKNIYDPTVSVGGVVIDKEGNLYASDMFGNIYIKNDKYDFEKIYTDYHFISKGLTLYEDDEHKYLYLSTFGGGMLKLELEQSKRLEDKYTVTFDTDGGSEVLEQIVKSKDKVKKPDDPVKDGYIFVGWYKDLEKTEEFDFDKEIITSDTVIYAKWIKSKQTYEILEGDMQTYTLNSGKEIVIKANGDVSKFEDLKLNGKIIDKEYYSVSSDENGTIITLDNKYLDTLSEGSYTITFVYNDGAVDALLNIVKSNSTETDEKNPNDSDVTPPVVDENTSNGEVKDSVVNNKVQESLENNEQRVQSVVSVPNTGINSSSYLYIIGIVFLISGVTILKVKL